MKKYTKLVKIGVIIAVSSVTLSAAAQWYYYQRYYSPQYAPAQVQYYQPQVQYPQATQHRIDPRDYSPQYPDDDYYCEYSPNYPHQYCYYFDEEHARPYDAPKTILNSYDDSASLYWADHQDYRPHHWPNSLPHEKR